MGQKVNPHGLRVGVIKDWDSRWYASDDQFGDILVSDYKIREYLKKALFNAGVAKIEIERPSDSIIRVYVHCAKPGYVIHGPKTPKVEKKEEPKVEAEEAGAEEAKKAKEKKPKLFVETIREKLAKMTGKTVYVNAVEVGEIALNAQLVAENICGQLERRIAFRRAMKQAIKKTMDAGAKGIKIACSGRLAGAEIARTEHYHEGTIPLQEIRANIDYGFWEANTTYGKIGVKVWIYTGQILSEVSKTVSEKNDKKDNKKKSNKKSNKDRRAPRASKKVEGGER
ncbi:MAG: 30S ribosomal protein S3 [Clostridia bacterium]|nr:30S ribosomal protein S3 [Clostridia bacterium]